MTSPAPLPPSPTASGLCPPTADALLPSFSTTGEEGSRTLPLSLAVEATRAAKALSRSRSASSPDVQLASYSRNTMELTVVITSRGLRLQRLDSPLGRSSPLSPAHPSMMMMTMPLSFLLLLLSRTTTPPLPTTHLVCPGGRAWIVDAPPRRFVSRSDERCGASGLHDGGPSELFRISHPPPPPPRISAPAPLVSPCPA